jgi:hypothetical protein
MTDVQLQLYQALTALKEAEQILESLLRALNAGRLKP